VALITTIGVISAAVIGNCEKLQLCAAQDAALDLTGTWSGAAASTRAGEFDITFRFYQPCRAGEICGTFEMSLGCGGDVRAVDISDRRLHWIPVNQSCGSVSGTDSLTLNADGTLHYRYDGTDGNWSDGTLSRQ
jgi:hypothetical protein